MKLQNKVRRDSLSHYGFGIDEMKRFKVCPSCNSLETSNYSKCTNCKSPLLNETLFDLYKSLHNQCPRCGTVVSEHMRYCPHCGTKVELKKEIV